VSALHRPEIGELHLAALLASGLDRGLIHRFHPVRSDRVELSVVDGLQQRDRLLAQLRQPGSADLNATVLDVRIASMKMLLADVVASPEVLPVRARDTMMPSRLGRHHEQQDEACYARRTRRRHPGPVCGCQGQTEAQNFGRVHRDDGLSREVCNPSPEQTFGAEATPNSSAVLALR
jgi:hypothetical protein